jgi:hypothetical protein
MKPAPPVTRILILSGEFKVKSEWIEAQDTELKKMSDDIDEMQLDW